MSGAAARPLVITDCDEVLLRMVAPFRDWLAEAEGVEFRMEGNDFSTAMRWQDGGGLLAPAEIWDRLGRFFDTEMPRQTPFPGAMAAMAALQERADVVVLTNLEDHRQAARTAQLADHGFAARVYTNQGPKGPAIRAIIDSYAPTRTVFIDDLPQHHRSARETVPGVTTLHLCGEPLLAPHIACAHRAGDADARIDTWDAALPWLLDQLDKDPA